MKKLHLISICLLSAALNAQITVSTLTPEFNGSGGMSLDDDGNLYIADFGDFLGMADPDGLPNHIMKLDTDLNLTQYSTDFVGASGNDFDSNGVLYQSDIRASAIYKIVGGVRTFVTDDGIVAPVGIVFDSNDNFFVCNCGSNTIQKVTPSGTSTIFASGGLFSCPNGITIDEDDNLYVANFSNFDIIKITPSGAATSIGNTGAGNGHLDYDSNSRNLYIASYGAQMIFSLNIDNLVLTDVAGTGVRGNDDGDGSTATFSTPNGIAVTQSGDSIYVNCAVPLSGAMINPQVVRLVTGLNSLSVDEYLVAGYTIQVYPNPTASRFTIEADFLTDYSNLSVRIYSLQGKIVKEITAISTFNSKLKETIDITEMASGNYLFSVFENSTQVFNGKIIKE